jgi:hypothetical protein
VLSSSRSSTADTHTERSTAHHHHGSRDGQRSLQGIREAVSDIYEVEEGILNETSGKVGGVPRKKKEKRKSCALLIS